MRKDILPQWMECLFLCAGLFCFEKNFRIIDLNQVPDKTENERCSIIYCDNKSGTIFHIRK